MRLGSHIVRFDLRGIPVVGNTITGTLVGLTPEGAALCDAMLERDVAGEDIPVECEELVSYLTVHGFEEGAGASETYCLSSAYLHVSNTCNLSCVGCYSADCNRNRAADSSLENLCHAITVLAQLGVTRLVVSGGEPFLRRDLPDIVRNAREQGMENIAVLTNGTRCSEKVLARLAGNVDVISVSFDGANPESAAFIRGEQLFDTLVDAVKRIQAAGIHAHMLPTLHARNI
ncbi:MAG: radical SAM protein [Collinsella stercoris]|nr:radical SAM protein [Collinsella stercoris]